MLRCRHEFGAVFINRRDTVALEYQGIAATVVIVVQHAGVDLEVNRLRRLAAVLVWNPAGLSESCRPPVLSPDMVPLRTRLQLILPMSENDVMVSCHGRVLKARVLFDSHARDADV